MSTSSDPSMDLQSAAQSFSDLKRRTLDKIVGNSESTRAAQYRRALNTKDPLTLPTFAEQGASVEGKLKRLQANPEYQKLPPQDRVNTRLEIYNKYVVPSFKAAGQKAPDVKVWLKGTKDASQIDPNQQLRGKTEDVVGSTVTSAVHAAQGITLFGATVGRQFLREAYGMAEYFSIPKGKEESFSEARAAGIKAADKTIVNKAVKSSADAYHQTEFWLQTHPRQSMLASASSWTGEQVVQLPIYEALGAVKVAEGAVALLTPRLLATPVGRFAARRLGDAFAGFASNMVTTGNEAPTKENLGAAAGFAVFGGALDGAGQWLARLRSKVVYGEYILPIKTASDSAMKKLTAESIAMGGQPFAHDVTDSSFNELVGNPSKELGATTTPVNNQHLDPTLQALHHGEKMSLQSIALRHYGLPLEQLDHETQQKVLQRRYELIAEAAAELPAHVPDLARQETEHTIQAQATGNPQFASSVERLKKEFGIDVSEVVTNNMVDDVKVQTGIKSSEAAVTKAAKVQKRVRTPRGTDEAISPKAFAQHRIDSAAYFKKAPGPRLAADGTKIGARDKRTWNERLKAENTKEFVETLKEADGNRIKFENPYHRMLFHWANRDQLPQPVVDKLFREMKKIEPGLNKPELNNQAARLAQHLQMLAQTGRLTKEQNVFKSTKVNGTKFTEWQADLNTEIDKQELAYLAKTIEQHPNGLKAMKGIVSIFQANRRMNLGNPEEWGIHNKVLSNLLSGVIE